MKRPKYSVIIPLYNKKKEISATVESVLFQSEQDFELLVVNDGSTDGSADIVRKIRDPRLRLIEQENRGVSAARNRGIREARGEILCFLDGDDLWDPNFLAIINELFAAFPEAAAACPSYQVLYGERVVHPKWRSVSLDAPSLVKDFFEMATAPFWVMNSSCLAVKSAAVHSMDVWFPEGERVNEDLDFFLRLGARYPVAHSPKVAASYLRITGENARNQHKVVYSKTYMDSLKRLQADPNYTEQQKIWLKQMEDRRMVPYIFSLLLCGQRGKARQELQSWAAKAPYKSYRLGLLFASFLPHGLIELVQEIRYRRF